MHEQKHVQSVSGELPGDTAHDSTFTSVAHTGLGSLVMALFEAVPEPLMLVDRGWHVEFANSHLLHLLGMNADEVLKKSARDLFAESCRDAFVEACRRQVEEPDTTGIVYLELPRPESQGIPVEARFGLLQKQFSTVVVCFRELAEEIVEERNSRIDVLEKIIASAVHKLNNNLTIVNGYSDMMLAQQETSEFSANLLREIRKAGEQSAIITRQLLDLERARKG